MENWEGSLCSLGRNWPAQLGLGFQPRIETEEGKLYGAGWRCRSSIQWAGGTGRSEMRPRVTPFGWESHLGAAGRRRLTENGSPRWRALAKGERRRGGLSGGRQCVWRGGRAPRRSGEARNSFPNFKGFSNLVQKLQVWNYKTQSSLS
jgi:hypothetical protein